MMQLNVGIAIDAFAVSVTRTRKADGSYNADGVWIPGTPAAVAIKATVQPVSGDGVKSSLGRELMDMPEGIRTEAKYIAWSRSELLVDDAIAYKSGNYRVLFVWDRDTGGFSRGVLGSLK